MILSRQRGLMLHPGREIASGVAARVAKYKQLGEVVFVEVLPRSLAGKLLRKELRKL